jgi:hypothetical protein
MKTKPLTDDQKGLLGGFAENHPHLEPFIRAVSKRQRNSATTELDSFLTWDGIPKDRSEAMARRDAIEFFRILANAGIGDFRIGRRGKPTRFTWNAQMMEVAKVALQSAPQVSNETVFSPDAAEFSIPDPDGMLAVHTYRLRKDLEVQLSLPIDLSTAEAKRLAAFIETLPIVEE